MVAEKLEERKATGKENAVPARELANICGFKDERELRSAIAKERGQGAVILSASTGHGGYYLPETRSEVAEFCHTLEARARSTFKAMRSARYYLATIEGQENLFKDGRENDK